MLTIAPDLIEAMLEILQKTRWLQTALAVIEFQQMVVQAVYVRVRAFEFGRFLSRSGVWMVFGWCVVGKGLRMPCWCWHRWSIPFSHMFYQSNASTTAIS